MATYRSRAGALQTMLRAPGQPVHRMVDRIVTDLHRQARVATSQRVNRLTGAYEGGFVGGVYQAGPGPRGFLANTAPHALCLELGTRPHVIRPRRPGGVLRFRVGNRTVYAVVVNHPGTRPYRILETALDRATAPYR